MWSRGFVGEPLTRDVTQVNAPLRSRPALLALSAQFFFLVSFALLPPLPKTEEKRTESIIKRLFQQCKKTHTHSLYFYLAVLALLWLLIQLPARKVTASVLNQRTDWGPDTAAVETSLHCQKFRWQSGRDRSFLLNKLGPTWGVAPAAVSER